MQGVQRLTFSPGAACVLGSDLQVEGNVSHRKFHIIDGPQRDKRNLFFFFLITMLFAKTIIFLDIFKE